MSAVAAEAAVVVPGPRVASDVVEVRTLPDLFVPEASQWLSSSAGRRALDGYSWMQSVHWVAGSGLYKPRRHRSHGPRAFGPTTVHVAQELAALFPCRPGIEYLVRRTGLSERSVQNHLQILREAGLLAWIVKGTRVRGERAQASEFALMVPPEFDRALGIRTAGEGTGRRVVGIAEAGRKLMAKLATRAARKVRRPRRKPSTTTSKPVSKAPAGGAGEGAGGAAETVVSGGSRCTPMGGGSPGGSSAGGTYSPPESKLASGASKSPTPKKVKAKAAGGRKPKRSLNKIGRRFQLAGELTRRVEWLRGCSVPRIAWVAREVADAGWTADEVLAWLEMRGTAERVRRGSGLLAVLLASATTVLDTPAKRAGAVEQWHRAEEARRRHRIKRVRASRERNDGGWQAPASRAVRREVEAAFDQLLAPAPVEVEEGQGLVLDGTEQFELGDEELAPLISAMREELSYGRTDLVSAAIETLGAEEAARVLGEDLVRRALQLEALARNTSIRFGTR
ncbi:transcriptional regulator [Streptomyces sp. NPDC004435]|uniref:transcriptional regulator n=1 Tax=Streptomyces sp. NPDC004435 TaxID=3364701 RepID=UPI0036A1D8DD